MKKLLYYFILILIISSFNLCANKQIKDEPVMDTSPFFSFYLCLDNCMDAILKYIGTPLTKQREFAENTCFDWCSQLENNSAKFFYFYEE